MPADSAVQPDYLIDVRNALGAVCAVHDDYAEFFDGVFSRLESMSDVVHSREEELKNLRQQQQQWEQERSALERELEVVRNRAAEMSEMLVQQKRDAEQQQSQWVGELKRLRKALQEMAHRMDDRDNDREEISYAETNATPAPVHAAAAPDPVLDSVMAQFEVLRKDVARRRDTQRS